MTPAQIANYVDAASVALDLRLRPEHRPGVLGFFAIAADFAAVVDAAALDAHDDSALSFVPVAPPESGS